MANILHVTSDPPEMDGRLLRYQQAATAAGFDVEILLPNDQLFLQIDGVYSKIEAAISYFPTAVFGEFWVRFSNRLSGRFDRLKTKIISCQPDLIHAHNWETYSACIAAGIELDVPVIADVHEFASGMNVDQYMWRIIFSKHIAVLEKRYLNKADAVITISDSLAAILHERYALESVPEVIRNVPPLQDNRLKELNVDDIILHYHGAFNRDRKLERLIGAIALLPKKFSLVLAGAAHNKPYENSLKSLIEKENLSDRIVWSGPFENEDAVSVGLGCDIGYAGMLPERKLQSRYALPNKVSEYLMSGLAVLGGPSLEFVRLNDLHQFGVVSNNSSAAEIAEAILSVNTEEIQRMKKNALKLSKELNWDKEKMRVISLYKKLLEGTRNGAS